MYTAPHRPRWRPVADRALLSGPSPPLTLDAAVRLDALLSAPTLPPAVDIASEICRDLYGVAAVGRLWTLGAQWTVDVASLDGYDALQRHLQLLREWLALEAAGGTSLSGLSPA